MKLKIFGTFLVAALAFSFSYQTNDEGCKAYFPIQKGMEWTYEDYDKKDKLSGTQTTIVEDVKSIGDGVMEYQIKGINDGPKGKEKNHHENSFTYTCENGKLKMDMESMVPQEQMESMKEMEIEIEQTELLLPSELKAGDKLKDGSINMKASMNGMQVMDMQLDVVNRTVEKFEEVETKAGKFNCAVISYDTKMKMSFIDKTYSGKDWISPNVGVVKTESYKENGELMSYRLLKSFSSGN